MTLGENLQNLRKEKGLSQEEVAKALFVTRQTISKWETGKAEPGVSNLKALAELYGVTLEQLVLWETPQVVKHADSTLHDSHVKERSLSYLFWTALLIAVTVMVGIYTMENDRSVSIPFSLIAMVIGIWVRYPAMWIVIQCIFTVSLLFSGVILFLGDHMGWLHLLVNGGYILVMYTPSIRRRFGMKKNVPMTVLGITGPTGAGKTTALREVEKLGGSVIDCDVVYHELLESDLTLQRMLESAFGPLRNESGAIDRKKLGTIVFGDPEKLKKLNTIAQTATVKRTQERLEEYRAKGKTLVAIDAIGLLESPLKDLCSATVAVIAPPEVRVKRIMARESISEEYAWSRVRAQKPDDYFTQGCDYTLWNDCAGPEEFALQAKTLIESILGKDIQ
ncbi:dephospho-CoA kinase [Pseudoflavonifractor sp. AF19-9AC]|uniref:dephospho-CoA kinase n=1 Tax=Pseudoflavonifractor sp. AF19-9AC TaxID=2292244 RepID=UPI000E47C658|nr:dephospho-CoA kinase [Pseudoflavonifractor sp. AF19-9AC]RHR08926.1 dephospho-CoA kinase [Pseudoflavonifractor sp. AF19-9AC]